MKFPLYFQVLASEATLAGGFYGIVREFGWRKVAIITQNENLFTVVSSYPIIHAQTTVLWKVLMAFLHNRAVESHEILSACSHQ